MDRQGRIVSSNVCARSLIGTFYELEIPETDSEVPVADRTKSPLKKAHVKKKKVLDTPNRTFGR